MTQNKRTIFFLSDHTGITVENMGRALLSQFEGFEYEIVHWPFIDSVEKARQVATRIEKVAADSALPPIVFSTLVEPQLRRCFADVHARVFDFFAAFTQQLEQELHLRSAPRLGHYHSMSNSHAYNERIHAVNFAFTNDDGAIVKNYPVADIILVGVSRSGKTPTCLFLGLQHGLLAANYPLTEDDLGANELPAPLQTVRQKLFGLTIDPRQLQRIRQERRPNSRYASLEQCQREIRQAVALFQQHQIPFLDTTAMSIEEIAARLVHQKKSEK
jgi:regulator of PEP synthase PpsR (kinase-PPPase family)